MPRGAPRRSPPGARARSGARSSVAPWSFRPLPGHGPLLRSSSAKSVRPHHGRAGGATHARPDAAPPAPSPPTLARHVRGRRRRSCRIRCSRPGPRSAPPWRRSSSSSAPPLAGMGPYRPRRRPGQRPGLDPPAPPAAREQRRRRPAVRRRPSPRRVRSTPPPSPSATATSPPRRGSGSWTRASPRSRPSARPGGGSVDRHAPRHVELAFRPARAGRRPLAPGAPVGDDRRRPPADHDQRPAGEPHDRGVPDRVRPTRRTRTTGTRTRSRRRRSAGRCRSTRRRRRSRPAPRSAPSAC